MATGLWAKLPRGKGAAPPPRRPRVQSDGEPRTKPVTLDARSVATAAVALGCDPVALERRNRASPGLFPEASTRTRPNEAWATAYYLGRTGAPPYGAPAPGAACEGREGASGAARSEGTTRRSATCHLGRVEGRVADPM